MDLLREAIAALFRSAPGERRLGDEPPGPIADAVLGAVTPLLAQKDAEVERLHSWAGLMELLDEHWPAEVFDGQSDDPGPRIVSLIRALNRSEASRRDWAAIAMTHDMAAEWQAVGTLDDPWPQDPGVSAPCSCLTSEGAAQVAVDPRWSLPLCAVHPEVER